MQDGVIDAKKIVVGLVRPTPTSDGSVASKGLFQINTQPVP